MALFDELRQQMSAKYGKKKKKEEPLLPVAGDSSSAGAKTSFDSMRKNLSKKYNPAADVDTDYIDSFLRDSSDFLKSAETDYNSMTPDTSSQIYASRHKASEDLNKRRNAIKSFLEQNRDRLDPKAYGDLAKYLDDFAGASGQLGYVFYDANRQLNYDNPDNRLRLYNTMQDRLKTIETEMKTATGDNNKALKDEKKKLEDSVRQYERTQYKADSYSTLYKKKDFARLSSKRDFNTPTREEFRENDVRLDSGSWYYDAGGKLYNALGEAVEDGYIYTYADGSWKLKNNGNVDRLGVFLNATEDEYTDAVGKTGSWEKIINDGLHGSWDMLTKKEINAYYYLLNTEGYEAADKFLEDMTPELNRRTVEQTNENIKKAVENGNILGNAALGAYSVISKPLGNMAAAADDALSLILEGEINPYSTAHELKNTANQIRGSQAEAIDKATGGAKIPIFDYSAGEAYQAAMSTLDTITSKFTGAWLYSAQMSAGAFSDKVTDLYLQGASKTEIASLGAIAAAAEYYFEKFSIDRLIHIGDSKTLSQILKNTLMQGVIEESEEMLTEATNIIADGIIRGGASEWNKLLEESDGNVLLALGKEAQQIGKAGFSGFISGMLAGGVASAGNYVQNQIETHQIGKKSDLKAIEGKLDGMIADPELDGDTKKLLEAVREDIKSGKIDTDKIEQIFGGDKYTVWKDADRKESELIEEYEKLADTPSMELSRNQQKRLDELEGQLENLRGKTESNRLYGELTGYVSEQIDNSKLKDSKLNDIYNDKVSRRTKFTADVSKYSSEAARRSIQNLIDTGYANNSKETHEFADNVAKLAERTGKVFSFVNDEQIREMGKAVEGRRVNGFVTEDGIAVNLDSRKAWEFIVGHEVTHVIEGLNSYTELHDALKEYATQRGEWDGRLKELTELYEGQDADVEAELVADLVGEYLFGDTDFISSLAAKNPNVFQKIYAAIKHLLKTVTAGSKQARQLERAKYAFEKAMREAGKAKVDGTEYSLSGDEDFYLDDEILLEEEILSENNVNKNEIAEAYGGDGSVNNENPTLNPDIRYSLSSMGYTFFGNENTDKMRFKNRDYKETEGYKAYVDQCVDNYRQTRGDIFDEETTRKEIEDAIDGIVKVAVAAKEAGYDIADNAERRNKRDSKGRLLFSSLEPNSDYFTSNDISSICDKRKNFAEIYDDIVKAEEKKGVPENKRFFRNVDNYFYLHQLMAEKGLTQPCRQCYVESMRKNLAPMADAFLRLVGETDPNNKANDQLFQTRGKNKGQPKVNNTALRERVLEALASYSMSPSDLNIEKLTTADGLAELKITAPNVYEAFNSFYGQSKPKMPREATPFRFGELTALLTDEKGKIKQNLVDRINKTGGFRLQSYSDFQIENFVDTLQVIFEAGSLGLKGHAYTKVPAFLDATKGTNLKRNISIFMYSDGGEWKIDRNDSFPYTLDEIYDIVKADKTGNTSIIAVSQNADMSAWIMANDLVGYGIPFHKSGIKMDVVRDTTVKEGGREIKGYSDIKDHTRQQSEVYADSKKKVSKPIDIYEFWDFENTEGLPKNKLIEKNLKAYIDRCFEAGYLPKFREYIIDNGKVLRDVLRHSKNLGYSSPDATIDDISFEHKGLRIPYGYYKFLGDFGMFAPDGSAAPAQTLSLNDYNFDDAVKFFDDSEGLHAKELLQQFANGNERKMYREMYDKGEITIDGLETIIKQKRGEIVDDVVSGKKSYATSLSRIGEDIADRNAHMRLNPLEDVLPVREDVTRVQDSVQDGVQDARNIAEDEDVMPMPEAEQRIDLKYLMEEDDTLSVREDAPAKEPGERQTRIDEIFNALHGKASNRYYKVMGYGVYVGRHKTTDNATITIKKPNGENIREQVEGGRHWSNDQLYTYAAELIADAEGYVADTTLPVIEDAQTANASETAEDVPITTVRERLEKKKANYESELDSNRANRKQAWDNYDDAIAQAQSEYDGLKNKDTKKANNLLLRIDRLKRQQANVDAYYAKRIADLEARIGRTDAELQKDHTRADNLERAFARIDNELAKKKAALAESFAQRRAELTRQIGNRNAFISSEAGKLYDELTNLRKGVRASKDLGYLLDLGYDWKSLKAALAHARAFPDRVVNTTSEVEAVVRESLLRSYEARTEELADLENEQSRAEAQLDMEAEIERDSARKAEDILRRTEVHENYVNEMKAEFSAQGYDLDTVLRRAKNLSTFATVDNTPQRVMQKSLGYKEGDILADITVNRVAQNETEAIKWLNSFTDRKNGVIAKLSKKYNIKPGSKQSMAAQMYAEGYYVNEQGEYITYGDHELAADFPNVRVQENIKGLARDPIIRRIYDETLDAINDSRVRNAYPEIQRLNNYFLHFQAMDDAFSRLGIPFNPNDIKAKDLPTDINGMTADLKPGQPYFASARHRLGIRTTFDLLGGLEKYLTSAKNQIYHIDDIQRLRALRNYIADDYGQAKGLESLDALTEEEAEEKIKQVFGSHLSTFAKFLNEEANILAGKTALIDRGLEGIIGRRGLTFIGDVNKQVGANQVGFNLGSSLTNFLALVQAFAKMNKFDFMKGFTQTVANRLGSIIGKGDGFENSVMVRREGAHRFHRTAWQKMSDPGYALMGAVDSISTEIIARAKYNELTRKNKDMTPEQAHFETDKWVSALMGDRSLGQMPQIYNSRMLGLITKYQLEVRNQLDSMVYDTIQETKLSNEEINNKLIRNAKTAAKVASTWFTLAVAQNLFGKVFESIVGYNPAFDIIEAISAAMGWDDDDDSEDTVLDNIEEGFLTLLEDLPYSSLILDGGRIPISGALPIGQLVTGENDYGQEVSRLDTVKEALPYYVMPAGYGQLKKTVAGLKMFDSDLPVSGSYMDKGALRFPVEKTPWNVAQAALFGQWASENARDYFDNERKPLEEKQINEYIDSEMTIQEYWNYRAGLSGLKTLEEKADYINSLDIPLWKKNLFINNIADRKEDINMEDYGEYGSLEEFDFANEYPEKYAFFKDNGISYNDYDAADKVTKSAYDWAAKDEDRYAFLEGEGISLEDPSAFDSEEEKNAYTWAYKNPEKYAVAKAVSGDVVTYKKYTGELSGIKADKDENGKSISGSRKEKVLDYINGLDIDYGEKIILFKNEYNADDTYNYDIINYLNSRDDISYSEMETILKELGFDVDSEGNVSW